MQKGINFDKYDDIPVECTGNNSPKSGVASYVLPSVLLLLAGEYFKIHLEWKRSVYVVNKTRCYAHVDTK